MINSIFLPSKILRYLFGIIKLEIIKQMQLICKIIFKK